MSCKEIFESLYLVMPDKAAAPTPFTYLLKRPEGNILLGTKANIAAERDKLVKAGGVAQILLGDRHHALPHSAAFAQALGAPLCCSAIEALPLKRAGVPVATTFPVERAQLHADLEIIPTPGHTPGALSYLWTHAGRRFLFVGDTLVPVEGRWQYWVSKPKRPQMLQTIRLLATVPFDVIVSNSFGATPVAWLEVNAKSRRAIFAALEAELAP